MINFIKLVHIVMLDILVIILYNYKDYIKLKYKILKKYNYKNQIQFLKLINLLNLLNNNKYQIKIKIKIKIKIVNKIK